MDSFLYWFLLKGLRWSQSHSHLTSRRWLKVIKVRWLCEEIQLLFQNSRRLSLFWSLSRDRETPFHCLLSSAAFRPKLVIVLTLTFILAMISDHWSLGTKPSSNYALNWFSVLHNFTGITIWITANKFSTFCPEAAGLLHFGIHEFELFRRLLCGMRETCLVF